MENLKHIRSLSGNMPKLKDINESERDAVVDKKGNILCPLCQKRQAIITDYGMIRKCKSCQSIKSDYHVMVSIQEPNGMRTY